MFPSSSSTALALHSKRSASLAFDPTEDGLSDFSKQKKKRFRSKPSSVTIVAMENFKTNIPRGKRRDQLRDAGRIKTIFIQRDMSSKQVRNAIKQGFLDKKLVNWSYLRCGSDGLLNVSDSQSLSGEDVVSKFSKGSLYLCERGTPVEIVSYFITLYRVLL